MKYSRGGEHYFGFANIGINWLAEHFIEFFDQFSMLITCLDSNPRVASLKKWIEMVNTKGWSFKVIGTSVWIARQHVPDVFRDGRTFYGFDEIYLLKSIPCENIDIHEHFTPEGTNFSEGIPDNFLTIFYRLGANRYVSDGLGLNFACESLEVVKKLEKIEHLE